VDIWGKEQLLGLGVENPLICSVRGCRLELVQEAWPTLRRQTSSPFTIMNCPSPFLLGTFVLFRVVLSRLLVAHWFKFNALSHFLRAELQENSPAPRTFFLLRKGDKVPCISAAATTPFNPWLDSISNLEAP